MSQSFYNLTDMDYALEVKPSYFEPSPEEVRQLNWEATKKQIGEIVIECQFLETTIKEAISTLLDPSDPHTGNLMTADMDFDRMIRVLFALFCHKHPNHAHTEEFREILIEVDKCRQRRNQLVHSYWFPNEDGTSVSIKYPKNKLGKPYGLASIDDVDADTLKEDANKFSLVWLRLRKFTLTHFPKLKLE